MEISIQPFFRHSFEILLQIFHFAGFFPLTSTAFTLATC